MEFEFFIGIDVSKNELDFAIQQGNRFLFHREVANQVVAINAFIKELNALPGFDLSKAIFCMEHTGIYNNHSLSCLYKKKAHICLEAATQIRNSLRPCWCCPPTSLSFLWDMQALRFVGDNTNKGKGVIPFSVL